MTAALLVVRSGLVMLGIAAAMVLVALVVCALWRVFNLPARLMGRAV